MTAFIGRFRRISGEERWCARSLRGPWRTKRKHGEQRLPCDNARRLRRRGNCSGLWFSEWLCGSRERTGLMLLGGVFLIGSAMLQSAVGCTDDECRLSQLGLPWHPAQRHERAQQKRDEQDVAESSLHTFKEAAFPLLKQARMMSHTDFGMQLSRLQAVVFAMLLTLHRCIFVKMHY